MSLLVDSQLFPCVDYIKQLMVHTHVVIDKYELFKKMSFRNRYIISGANNLINLSIPILGGREQKTLMKDVRINNVIDWQRMHWRTLLSAYSKAPFFEFYSHQVKTLIFSGDDLLYSLNLKVLTWVINVLKINIEIEFTEEPILSYDNNIDCRNYFWPKSFQKNTINWHPKYPQVFENRLGFQPNLSIIDLIFCVGPNAQRLLSKA